MSDFRPSNELLALTAQLTDGGLNDAELARLQELVANDHQSGLWFVEWMEISAMLHLDFGGQEMGGLVPRPLRAPSSVPAPAPNQVSRRQRQEPTSRHSFHLLRGSNSWVVLATCLLMGLSYLMGMVTAGVGGVGRGGAKMVSPPLVNVPAPAVLKPVATISGGVDAVFGDDLVVGSRISPGVLRLQRGLAQIAFDSGAILVLEGPAEFEVIDSSTCRLLSGSLSADVFPDATGFSVAAGTIKVAEQDAQFGLRTGPERETEVHVFGGELQLVDFKQSEGHVQKLLAGEAMRWQTDSLTGIAPDPGSFVTRQELARRQRLSEQKAYARWLDYSKRWLTDPSVVLRYEFGTSAEGGIVNSVNSGRHQAVSNHDSLRWIEGRWSDKPAILFDGRTDVLQIDDHADLRQHGNMTMAVWLRSRSHPRSAWARVVGKGFGPDRNYGLWVNPQGQFLWQVIPEVDPESQAVWDRHSLHTETCPLGEWLLFVGVIDGNQSRVYVNGVLHNVGPAPQTIATNDDPLTIGFYGEVPGHNDYFCGDLDELILLNRALNPAEIRQMYEAGRPEYEGHPNREDEYSSARRNI